VTHELDPLVAGEPLARLAEHEIGEVETHARHLRTLALEQGEQSAVAGTQVEDAPSLERHVLEQDALSLEAMRELVGSIEIATDFPLVECPLLAWHV
jgi:hypothetical protein